MQEQQTVGTVLAPFQEMWGQTLDYVPALVAGLLILVLGLVVAWLVKRATARVLLLLRLDRPLRTFRVFQALGRADVRHALATAVGNGLAVIVFLVFLDNALVVWRLDVLAQLIGRLVFLLPQMIVALVVLALGSAVAAAVARRVRTGLALEGFGGASLAGRVVHWALQIVVIAFALEELDVAPQTLQSAFRIGLATLGLATALAFGLGSRDAVARLWGSFFDSKRPADAPPPAGPPK